MSVRILIVDDDDHVRDALVEELSASYQVHAVGSGGEAMAVMGTEQYDVVISDLKMPDHDGIEVLEYARSHQGDAVRVLLTGYLDANANTALQGPGAPYKVGKPWHDEVEIAVRRGLEHRDAERRLAASVEDALQLSSFDDELAAATTANEIDDVVVRRVLTIEGVTACVATRDPRRTTPLPSGCEWVIELPLDPGGAHRLIARGFGESARQLVEFIAHRAQRRGGTIEARLPPVSDLLGRRGGRTSTLMRQAAVGTLASSLLHDLASMLQNLTIALEDVAAVTERVPEAQAPVAAAMRAGEEIIQLFVEMRQFIRDGAVAVRPVTLATVVDKLRKAVSGHVRGRATLRIGAVPDLALTVSEPLFVQVLSNLVRNAANASPTGGAIDVDIAATAEAVVFTVTDDGPGVAPAIADSMFEAFSTNRSEGTGLGLAISAYILQQLGGTIAYTKAADRGARFTVTVPRPAD